MSLTPPELTPRHHLQVSGTWPHLLVRQRLGIQFWDGCPNYVHVVSSRKPCAPSLFYLSIRESLQLRERAADAPATQRRVRLPQPAGATSKHTTLLGAASQPPPRAPGARYNAGGSLYIPYKMKVGCTIVVHWRNHKQWTC